MTRPAPRTRPVARKTIWAILRSNGKRTGTQSQLAAACGPAPVTSLLIFWSLILILGFALVYRPRMGMDIESSSHSSIQSLDFALYFSGFTLTTSGVGDLYPATGWSRLLTVVQAWLGFTKLTLSISYTLSVHEAVRPDNALASNLDALETISATEVEAAKKRPELDLDQHVYRRAAWEGKLRSLADYFDVDWESATCQNTVA